MPTIRMNTKKFEQTMMNIVQYSSGFLDGIQKGKRVFLNNLGEATIDAAKAYIDTNARMNPEALHHVYEWYSTGSPNARLYDLNYTVSNLGLSIKSSFKQSNTIKDGSSEPFYNKAKIMEEGIPVIIRPEKSSVLVFEDDGETVFTAGPVYVDNPGGPQTTGGYEQVFDEFFSRFFSQAFLRGSGILNYLENPSIYKKNISSGARQGRSVGIKTGYTWIINAKAVVPENG